jgi:hypothetical protein
LTGRQSERYRAISDLAAMKQADDGIAQTVAPVEEVQPYVSDGDGKRVDISFRNLIATTCRVCSAGAVPTP